MMVSLFCLMERLKKMENKYAMINDFGLKNINIETKKYTEKEKKCILSFFSGCDPFVAGGYIQDAISKEEVHTLNCGYIKDGFIFTDSDIYHLKKYDAAVTDEFYDHVMKGTN